jgi:preprotein translocase subunit SecG
MLSGLLTVLLIFVALVLIVLIIVLQHGNEGGIGSAFGSGNSAGFFGASGGVSLIIRATWIFGALFFATAMALSWVKTREHFGVGREIKGLLGSDPSPAASPTPGVSVSPVGSQNAAPAAPGDKPASVSDEYTGTGAGAVAPEVIPSPSSSPAGNGTPAPAATTSP